MNATSDQLTWIEEFLTQRGLHFNEFDRLWKILEAARIDQRNPGDGTPISYEHAEQIRSWLYHNHGAGSGQPQPSYRSTSYPGKLSGHTHRADRNGNCDVCGAEMFDPSLRASAV